LSKSDVSRALKIFEPIKARGVGLDPMDLLENLWRPRNFTGSSFLWSAETHALLVRRAGES
jgi:hypothetical protein